MSEEFNAFVTVCDSVQEVAVDVGVHLHGIRSPRLPHHCPGGHVCGRGVQEPLPEQDHVHPHCHLPRNCRLVVSHSFAPFALLFPLPLTYPPPPPEHSTPFREQTI